MDLIQKIDYSLVAQDAARESLLYSGGYFCQRMVLEKHENTDVFLDAP